uniref:Uncharacterized protein n=1 Tax=Pseudopediastrum boryanum TaxID=55410 RepID=A0A2U8GJA3_PSEBY|nr:hypothetical protein [Pseudopediastrum boryanum]AWI68714.1 hypothetical protein [Pseudopediastrum boryanum]
MGFGSKKAKTSKKGFQNLTEELALTSLAISIRDKKIYDEIAKKFKDLKASANGYGVGAIVYQGFSWANDSVFLGWCDALQSGTFRFLGSDSKETLEDFRKNFINKKENLDKLEKLSVTGFEGVCELTISGVNLQSELDALFEETMEDQETKQPKVSLDKKGALIIGSVSNKNYVKFSGISNKDKKLEKVILQAIIKLDGAGLAYFLKFNPDSTPEDLLASLVNQKFSKIKMVGIVNIAQTQLAKFHKLSTIKEQFKKDAVETSKSGKTTHRALKTVENKLAKKNETEETQELLLKWLNALKAISVKGVFEGSKLSDQIVKQLGKAKSSTARSSRTQTITTDAAAETQESAAESSNVLASTDEAAE